MSFDVTLQRQISKKYDKQMYTGLKKNEGKVTFEDMPKLMQEMHSAIKIFAERMAVVEQKLEITPKWLSVEKLIAYLPVPPTKRTIYTWMRFKKIPFYRREKSVYFLTSEIDEWLKSNPSIKEDLSKEKAEEYIKKHPLKK